MLFSLLKRLAAAIGTAGSLIALVWSFKPANATLNWWQSMLLALAGVLLVVQISSDFIDVRKDYKLRMPDNKRIRNYMFKWIREGGRVAIFSRDMTWAHDNEMRQLLQNKAESDELSLYLPQRTEMAEQLAQSGAHVFTYPELDYVARTRFTIVHEGRSDAAVAIGRRVDGVHLIEEYSVGSSPVFAMAEDLIEFTKRLSATSRK